MRLCQFELYALKYDLPERGEKSKIVCFVRDLKRISLTDCNGQEHSGHKVHRSS